MEKLTCFNITETAKIMEEEVIKKLDITKKSFHRRMIDNYLDSNMEIDERLLISSRSGNPDYVIRNAKEQIYLDPEREKKVKKVMEELSKKTGKNVSMAAVLFQAMINYLGALYPIVRDE